MAPDGAFAAPVVKLVGIALIGLGIWLNARGSTQFERAGTPIRPGSRGGHLVTGGVFSFSRNPMYLGMAAILLGAGLSLGSLPALLTTPVFMAAIQRWFIVMEERILQDEYGPAYLAYRQRVRRWI